MPRPGTRKGERAKGREAANGWAVFALSAIVVSFASLAPVGGFSGMARRQRTTSN
jgi:hypothetical protein